MSLSLFFLIKSLRKHEKRHFKLTSALYESENTYIKIFDFIEKMKEYDEQKLKEYFTVKYPTPHYLVIKNQLYEKILDSLRRQNEYGYIAKEKQLNALIENAFLLDERGLHKLAEREIRKAEKFWDNTDLPKLKLSVLQYKTIQYIKKNITLVNIDEFNALLNERLEAAANLLNYEKLSQLLIKIQYYLLNNIHDLTAIDSLHQELLAMGEPEGLLNKHCYWGFKSSYAQIMGNNEEHYLYSKLDYETWLNNQNMIINYFDTFMNIMYNYLHASIMFQKFEEALLLCDEYEQAIDKYKPPLSNTFFYQKNVQGKTLVMRLVIFLYQKEYNKVTKEYESQTWSELQSFFWEADKLHCELLFGIAFYHQNQLDQAQIHAEKVLSKEYNNCAPHLTSVFYRLYLVCLYERGDLVYLNNILYKIKENLQNYNTWEEYEKNTIRFFSHLLGKRYQGKPQKVFESFLPLFTELETQTTVYYLFMSEWINKQIKNL